MEISISIFDSPVLRTLLAATGAVPPSTELTASGPVSVGIFFAKFSKKSERSA